MKLKESKSLFNALADETRLRIVSLLTDGELCVCDLMCVLKEPQSKVSRHLAYLRREGVVEAKKEGLWMYYRLSKTGNKMVRAIVEALNLGRSEVDELKRDQSAFRKNKSCLVACCK